MSEICLSEVIILKTIHTIVMPPAGIVGGIHGSDRNMSKLLTMNQVRMMPSQLISNINPELFTAVNIT
jgi:hypothetical protein